MALAASSASTHASCLWIHRRPHGPPARIPSNAVSSASPRPRSLPAGVGASSAPVSFFRSNTCTRTDQVSTGAGCLCGRTGDGLSRRSSTGLSIEAPDISKPENKSRNPLSRKKGSSGTESSLNLFCEMLCLFFISHVAYCNLFGACRKMLWHMGTLKASSSGISPSDDGDEISDVFKGWKVETSSQETSLLAKLAIALGIAATITVISIYFKGPRPGSSFGFPFSFEGSSSLVSSASPVGFTFSIFGYKVVIPESTPGWVYFWLLMAAGCGLFISEEALNVWVGISLARTLSLDGTWKSFVYSFSSNAPYIVSTVLWVYWGVCISDMIPFYLGKLFRRTKASADICSKLGIGKDKVVSITRTVQKYGNMIGFVERFSVGVRNPTSFLAGAWGISSECFFAGVCCGGLITLPIQLGIGFLLRERPMIALASVATAVGIWTVFPYVLAACAALFIYLHRVSN